MRDNSGQNFRTKNGRRVAKMSCIILKYHSWEPEIEVTLSVIVSFIILRI